MSNATTADLMPEACSVIARVITGAAGADLAAAAPCDGFSLRTLLTNFTGTTGAFAYAGKTRSLDANDPWGSTVQLNEDEWPEQLTANLNAISAAWCQQDIWQGTIQGTVMPARSLGEMALIEVVLHGWDVARATGQQVEVSDALGAELLRCVAETADLGRQVGAYGPKSPLPTTLLASPRRLAWRVGVRTDQPVTTSAVPRWQLQGSPHSTPNDLARYAIGQCLSDRALTKCGKTVLRRPDAEISRPEMQPQALPELGLLHSRHCACGNA
jgi:uncharacterized protein (TIGR03086 family)